MWTNENRHRYDRSRLRYPSDLTDPEWALIEPLIPPAKLGGNKRTVVMREVVNAVMYTRRITRAWWWRCCCMATAAASTPAANWRGPARSGWTSWRSPA